MVSQGQEEPNGDPESRGNSIVRRQNGNRRKFRRKNTGSRCPAGGIPFHANTTGKRKRPYGRSGLIACVRADYSVRGEEVPNRTASGSEKERGVTPARFTAAVFTVPSFSGRSFRCPCLRLLCLLRLPRLLRLRRLPLLPRLRLLPRLPPRLRTCVP